MTDDWVRPTREQLIQWREDGLTWAQIGKLCGITRNPLVLHAATLNLPQSVYKRAQVVGKEAREAEIRHLVIVKQFSDRALATHLGLPLPSAQRRRRRAGVIRDENGKAILDDDQ